MKLSCDQSIAADYTSASQIARILSERWLLSNMYCLSCDSEHLSPTSANTRCLDFICGRCEHRYELKTFLRRPATSLVDGAYRSMIASMEAGVTPTLFLLHRDSEWRIQNLSAIHPVFLTPSVIDKRRPLGAGARRAGWTGCNIRLDRLPPEAEIAIIQNGEPRAPWDVRNGFRRLLPFGSLSLNDRGWTALTLLVVRRLGVKAFSLQDLYKLEDVFAEVYPGNHNIRPKIRQQVQRLRDMGMLRFCGRGLYELLP